MYYYKRFKDLREDKDLNQSDIAKLLDTTQQTYSLWERGEREMPLHHAMEIASAMNLGIDKVPMELDTSIKEC